MANAIYPKAKQEALQGNLDLDGGTVKVAAVDTGVYTYSPSHQYYSSISSAVQGNSAALASKTFTDGVFDADDTTITALTGSSVEALIVWIDTGNPATSQLVSYHDSGTGLPLTPNGGNVNIVFDSGANKIFKL